MKLAHAFGLSAVVSGVIVPGADTPLFYLVATGPDSGGVNFLPIRLHGEADYYSILTGNGPIAKFYFNQGQLVAQASQTQNPPPQTPPTPWRPFINTLPVGTGCATFGQLATIQGSSTNKCATYHSFQIESDSENSQLGARLVLNYEGGFYVCGAQKEVFYKVNPSDGPSGCTAIQLYTVPVVE